MTHDIVMAFSRQFPDRVCHSSSLGNVSANTQYQGDILCRHEKDQGANVKSRRINVVRRQTEIKPETPSHEFPWSRSRVKERRITIWLRESDLLIAISGAYPRSASQTPAASRGYSLRSIISCSTTSRRTMVTPSSSTTRTLTNECRRGQEKAVRRAACLLRWEAAKARGRWGTPVSPTIARELNGVPFCDFFWSMRCSLFWPWHPRVPSLHKRSQMQQRTML
jgi:hypothetical protein